MAKPKKRGRPALGDAKRARIVAHVDPATLARIEEIAAADGVTPGRVAGRMLDRLLGPLSSAPVGGEKK